MSTDHVLVADLTLSDALYERWLATELEGVSEEGTGWLDQAGGSVRMTVAELFAALAEASQQFSLVRAGDALTARFFFSVDVWMDEGPSLARALLALPAIGAKGTALFGDAGTRIASLATFAPGKTVKVGPPKKNALDVTLLQHVLDAPRTPFRAKPSKPAAKPSTPAAKSSKASPKSSKASAKASGPAAKPSKASAKPAPKASAKKAGAKSTKSAAKSRR
jgi:hypothetical protein